ncbi:hypothetical protein [Glaciecola sp. KUL10]|jgi:hypothetical protein|uniref:hypothetical protein n=1 Tax=Glaciecola sp. (strain KUL10) TaxID=2161813 RepID=UPI000D781E57|nr:hypothetical protein [Glaciecola sp. KUL10]GBL05061.1 hypothetical protein KUL10_23800 [Glaciecola sp. KUL10]
MSKQKQIDLTKKKTLKVPKKKQQLYTGINSIFGLIALIALCNALYSAYRLLAYEPEPHVHDALMSTFIKSLYYPVFFLVGYLMSRRAFTTKRFQTGIWLAFIVPLIPVLFIALSANS